MINVHVVITILIVQENAMVKDRRLFEVNPISIIISMINSSKFNSERDVKLNHINDGLSNEQELQMPQ